MGSLSGCQDGNKTMKAIANVIQANQKLSQIALNGCPDVTEEGVTASVVALPKNTGLKKLFLSWCFKADDVVDGTGLKMALDKLKDMLCSRPDGTFYCTLLK